MMKKRKFVRCSSLVDRKAITRINIDGVEHIIVSSFTLPDNIVMNGILYPSEEINASFEGLNRTLAPVEHPVNSNGQFVSANDPESIHNFHAGAFNDNAVKDGNRIRLDKIINVQEALKTEKGRRLLDRINEIETSKSPRPIETSTGIFLELEELDEPQTNNEGLEFQMIARNMVFDHDAILLDNVGAARPSQGVGMAINSDGEKIDVEIIDLDSISNIDGQSVSELHREVMGAFERSALTGVFFIEELFDDHVIFHTESGLFTVPFSLDQSGRATITGIPLPVERKVSFIPKTNSNEVTVMKTKIIATLNTAGVSTDDMDDDAILAAYNKLMTKTIDKPAVNDGDKPDTDEIIANAVDAATKPFKEQLHALEIRISANAEASKADMIKIISASSKYPDLDEDTLKTIQFDKLQKMAANCGTGHGIPLAVNVGADDVLTAPVNMPE